MLAKDAPGTICLSVSSWQLRKHFEEPAEFKECRNVGNLEGPTREQMNDPPSIHQSKQSATIVKSKPCPERDAVCLMTDLLRNISWRVIGEELKWQFRHDNCLSKNTRRFWKRHWRIKIQKNAKDYLRKTDLAFWAKVFFSSKFWMIWPRYLIRSDPSANFYNKLINCQIAIA